MDNYFFIDSGEGKRLEQFGSYRLVRPAAQAFYPCRLSKWDKDALFTREGGNRWKGQLPEDWQCTLNSFHFKISPTDFGHVGLFAEHGQFWKWIEKKSKDLNVLNLFAYSGGATLASASGGGRVCHLDASSPMIAWARENAVLNNLTRAPIRWICDDVMKFLAREKRRGSFYDAIICDPPSFGRGPKGEVFKIEKEMVPLLKLCRDLFSETPKFFLLTCHTPEITPFVLENLFKTCFPDLKGKTTTGEIILLAKPPGYSLPCGSFLRWEHA